MTRVALLDVNVLVALFDADHVHHEAAHSWLGTNRKSGWATCTLTENGLLRILSNTAYAGQRHRVADVRGWLADFCSSGGHAFWPERISIRDESLFDLSAVTHRQVTDVYLLGLAVANKGRLATLDRSIPIRAVRTAPPDSLEVVAV